MDIKVRAVNVEDKSTQEIEQELLDNASSETTSTETTDAVEPDELDETKVLSFIKNRYGKEIDSVEQLISAREETPDIPEDIASYLKYRNETGRSYNDYLKLNENFDELNEDELLKRYFISTEDGIDEEDVDVLMSDFSFDEDLDEESDIKKKRLARKKTVAKAKDYFKQQKGQYGQPLESSAAGLPPDEQEEFKAFKQYLKEAETVEQENKRKSEWFEQKTNEVLSNDFKGFEFKIGDKTFNYSPSNVEDVKKDNSSPMNFISKFINEEGLLTNAAEYHKSLSVAMNPSKFAQYFYEQGKADAVGDVSRKSKNINMDIRQTPQTSRKDGLSIRAVTPPSNGNRLVIRSNNNNN